jgi:hypothetical protein
MDFGLTVSLAGNLTGAQLERIANYQGIGLMLETGANAGHDAKELRVHRYNGRIVSLDPLSSAHAWLVVAVRSDDRMEVAPRMAPGNSMGKFARISPGAAVLIVLSIVLVIARGGFFALRAGISEPLLFYVFISIVGFLLLDFVTLDNNCEIPATPLALGDGRIFK